MTKPLSEVVREKLKPPLPADIDCKEVRELYFKFGREHQLKDLAPLHEPLLTAVDMLEKNHRWHMDHMDNDTNNYRGSELYLDNTRAIKALKKACGL